MGATGWASLNRATGDGNKVEVTVTLTRYLAPPIEDDLESAMQAELEAMAYLSDEALWQTAESVMNPDKVALYDLMLERLKSNQLTAEGQNLLDELRTESQSLMLRKAHAYALLQSRGHKIPSLSELQTVRS